MAPSPHTTLPGDAAGLLITILQLGQFVPQHYEMAVDRSVVGVSPWLLFFSSLYTYLAALDIIILDLPDALVCSDSAYRCFILAQPLIQMIGSAILSITMWYWFLKYATPQDPLHSSSRGFLQGIWHGDVGPRAYYDLFVAISAVFTLIAAGMSIIDRQMVEDFAYTCGTLSALLNGLMWLPQILVTYSFGHKGALSLGWVFASVVMDIAYSVYMAQMGMHWSVWANNIPDGVETGLLCILIIYFEYRDRRRGLDDYGRILSKEEIERDNNNTIMQV